MPEAFTIGPLLISTRTMSFVLSLLLAFWVSGRVANRLGFDKHAAVSIAERCAWIGIGSARLAYVIIYWGAFSSEPWTILYLWQPGYLPLVGVIAGAAFLLYRLLKRNSTERRAYSWAVGSGYSIGALLFVGTLATMNWFTGAQTLRPGNAVPNFVLKSLDDKTIQFLDLEANGVVLNFWATWCAPCRREMPLLNTVNQQYQGKRLKIVGVAVGEPVDLVRRFVDSIGVNYPIWANPKIQDNNLDDSSEVYSRFGGVGLPTTWFIDSRGIVKSSYVGELNLALLQERIPDLLPQSTTQEAVTKPTFDNSIHSFVAQNR
ncbi:MAG: redoxin domain-containing protein [Gammaproteobacteria bacterium]|nr:redoxin domain-containing protein [Gammaproteobacteria bacterium]